jgi:hypothetical protein
MIFALIVLSLSHLATSLALVLLCRKLYTDMLSMARHSAGMPERAEGGNARIISPYKKRGGEES